MSDVGNTGPRHRDPDLVALRDREGTCVCNGPADQPPGRGCDCGWFMDMDSHPAAVDCACYGCTIARQRSGVPEPDRSAEPCDPPDACARDGQCWTHSTWVEA